MQVNNINLNNVTFSNLVDENSQIKTESKVMSRQEAIKYKDSLDVESKLYDEVSRVLLFRSSIVQLSNGVKINTTEKKDRLPGGMSWELTLPAIEAGMLIAEILRRAGGWLYKYCRGAWDWLNGRSSRSEGLSRSEADRLINVINRSVHR